MNILKNVSRKEFDEHCEINKITAEQVNKLMPLVDLIPTLNEIVENQKANVYIGRKIIKIIGVISAIVGLLYLIFRFWREIKP